LVLNIQSRRQYNWSRLSLMYQRQ